MAQLTTTYSKELKEKIFILKGEEGYARTTDTLLDEILHNGERLSDWDTHKEYMLLEFRVDVLRDLGASQIVLYDNDEIIGVYDFAVGTHTIEFKYTSPTNDTRLKLEYGIEHNIYARYMGNKQCLKSTSKKYNFYEPIPERYESSIEIEGDTLYNIDATAEFTIRLVGADYYSDQEIIIYDNNTRVGTVRTDVNGEATVTIENLVEGKHTLIARFEGTDYLSSAEESIEYSAGAILSIIDYPSYQINTEHMNLTVKLIDYCNNPLVGETVNTQEYLIVNGQYYWLDEGTGVTDANGEAIIDTARGNVTYQVIISPNYFSGRFRARYGSMDLISDEVNITPYTGVTISLTQPTTLTGVNQSLTLTGNVSNVSEPVKVSLDNSIGTVTTDSNGNFTASYRGTGAGDVTVTASVYGSSASVTIEDVIQYWKANSTSYNVNYRNYYGSCTQLTNGWKCEDSIDDKVEINLIPQILARSSDFQLEYKIVSTSKSTVNISLGYHLDGYIQVTNLKSGDKVKLVSVDEIATLYVNNVSKGTFNSYSACLEFVNDDILIIVDEVKLKRLNND